jgi:hypothetical protein
MMNKSGAIFLSLFSFLQICCALNSLDEPLVILNATIVNEFNEPIENVNLTGVFPNAQGKGTVEKVGTDENGFGEVKGHARFGVNLIINKDGYYESKFRKIDTSEGSAYGQLTPKTRLFDVTLRRIINPRGLIAKSKKFKIPVKGEWVDYDLEQGDWVEPYGKGENGDVSFLYNNEFLGYKMDGAQLNEVLEVACRLAENRGEEWTEEREKHTYGIWSGRLDVKFSGEGEGIVKVVDSYLEHSEMKMPHMALEEGYEANVAWTGAIPKRNPILYQGYFLRVRVVKHEDEIIQANYAKINEEVVFDPRGTISFSYCFNPDVNDRNLEFDSSKNLLKNVE